MSRLNFDPVISVQFEPARPDVDPPAQVGERFRDHLETPPSREPLPAVEARPEPLNEQDNRREPPLTNQDRQPEDAAPANQPDHTNEHQQAESPVNVEPPTEAHGDRNEERADDPRPAASDTVSDAPTTQEFDDHLVIAVPSETASDEGIEPVVADPADEPAETDADVIAIEQVDFEKAAFEQVAIENVDNENVDNEHVDIEKVDSDEETGSTPLVEPATDSIEQVTLEATGDDAIDPDNHFVAIADDTVVDDPGEDEAPAEPKPTNLVTEKAKITTATVSPLPVEAEAADTPPVNEEPDTSPPVPAEIVSVEEAEPTSEPVVAVIPNATTTKKEPLSGAAIDERDEEATPRRDGNRRVSNRPAIGKAEPAVQRTPNQIPANSTSAAEKPEFQLQSVSDTSLLATETGTDGNSTDGNRDSSAVAKVETGASPTAVDRGGNARLAEKLLGASATRQEGKVELRHVDQARFVQRVAGAIARAGQRDGEIHLRLSPPELGSLRLQLKVEEGVLTARMEAENSAARGLILENLPTLRDRLAEQNIRIERFEVELGQQNQAGADQSRQQGHSEQRQSGSDHPRNAGGGVTEPAGDEAAPAQRTIAEKQINVVV